MNLQDLAIGDELPLNLLFEAALQNERWTICGEDPSDSDLIRALSNCRLEAGRCTGIREIDQQDFATWIDTAV